MTTDQTPSTRPQKGTATVYPQLKEILVTHAGLPADAIVPEATLAEAGIDSMAVTVLSMALEDTGLMIDEDDLSTAPSVAALADLIASRAAA